MEKSIFLQVRGSQLKEPRKGDILVMRHDDTVVTAWKDKRPVLVLSTYHRAQVETLTRKKTGGGDEEIQKLVVIMDYTAKMGGVDRADHYCASYNFNRKSKKWWQMFFFWILEVAIVNSFILFNLVRVRKGLTKVKNNCPRFFSVYQNKLGLNIFVCFFLQMEHIDYRRKLITQLIGDVRVKPTRKRPRSSDGDIQRMNGLFHRIRKGKNLDCVVCSDRSVPRGRKQAVQLLM